MNTDQVLQSYAVNERKHTVNACWNVIIPHYHFGPVLTSDREEESFVMGGGFEKSQFSWRCWRQAETAILPQTRPENLPPESVPESSCRKTTTWTPLVLALGFDNIAVCHAVVCSWPPLSRSALLNSLLSLEEDLGSCRASKDSPNLFKHLAGASVTCLPSELRICVTLLWVFFWVAQAPVALEIWLATWRANLQVQSSPESSP